MGETDILFVELALQLCDSISGGLRLLQEDFFRFGTQLSVCRFLQEQICSHRALHSLHEELLRAREKQILTARGQRRRVSRWTHNFHMLSVISHLALLYFCSQAVKAVENEVPVQLFVSAVDEAPDCFSLCFKTLPGAQRRLRTKKKLNYNKLLKNIVNPPKIITEKYWCISTFSLQMKAFKCFADLLQECVRALTNITITQPRWLTPQSICGSISDGGRSVMTARVCVWTCANFAKVGTRRELRLDLPAGCARSPLSCVRPLWKLLPAPAVTDRAPRLPATADSGTPEAPPLSCWRCAAVAVAEGNVGDVKVCQTAQIANMVTKWTWRERRILTSFEKTEHFF